MNRNIIWKNATHSAKDYLIYFLTVALAFSLVYAFNLLVFSNELMKLSSTMDVMSSIIIGLSILVVFTIGWLIHYMARFMLERRSREFGTYMLLGIGNKTIAGLFVRENILVGTFALIAGILAGTLLYQVLAMIIVRLFGASYQIHMVFSIKALGLTVLYAAFMYGNSMVRLRRYLKKVEVGELLYVDRQSENLKKSSKTSLKSFLLFSIILLVGCVCIYIGCSYKYLDSIGTYALVGCVGVTTGIYGMYTAVTAFLTGTMLKGDVFKYKKNRLFLLRGLASKLGMIGKTLGTLAILLTLTLTATATGVLFEKFFEQNVKMASSFDVTASTSNDVSELKKMEDYIKEEYGITFRKDYPLYYLESSPLDDAVSIGYIPGTPVLKWSDFHELWAALGYEELELLEGEYILVGAEKYVEKNQETPLPDVKIGGKTLSLQEIRTESFGLGGFHGTGYVITVADDLVDRADLPVYHNCLAIETAKEVRESDMELLYDLSGYNRWDETGVDDVNTNSYTENSQNAMVVILSFSLFYIGLIFACTAAAILAVQQLSEASRYKYRYGILSKLGMDEEKTGALIFQQVAVYFFVPLVIPIPLSLFITAQLNALIMDDLVTKAQFAKAAALSLGLFLFVYFLYFAATYLSYRNRIMEE